MVANSRADLRPAPLATPEQLALEAKARELIAHPRVQAVAAKVKAIMLAGYGADVPEEARARFDAELDEYMFSYVERVLCRDRNNFCLHYTCHPAYRRSSGEEVPGCRFYGENPDAVYRWGGLHPDRSYRLTCVESGPPPVDASFTLMGTYGGTTPGQSIVLQDAKREDDGSFVITIDTEPANGRPNHLQMTPRTTLLLIREFLGDWAVQTPLAMTLEAQGVTHGGEWDDDAALDDICHFASEEIYLYFWMSHLYRNQAPNTVNLPASAAALGGSASMATAQGYFELEEDQAAVFNWSPAGARLSGISALDWWYIPIESHWRQSTINNFVAKPNPDGNVTVVLSRRDPGIANWLDCGGLSRVLLTARWQGLPEEQVGDGPTWSVRIVKMSDLEKHLPDTIARCSATERKDSYARRLAAYARRTGDPDSKFADVG